MPRDALDQLGHRLERDLEALLVDEPADQDDELLARAPRTRRGAGELASSPARRSPGSMPLGITATRVLGHREDVGDLLAHVGRAGDHPVGAVRDPALDAVDVGLRVLVDPALVAAVLGGVDRGHERRAEAAREVVAGGGDEPVVAVDEVEVVAVAELHAGGEHVGVHPLHPGDELAEVARPGRLEDAMHVDPADHLLGRRLLAAAGQDVDLGPRATSASESLRTWRARPPSMSGGYSQERIRTRLSAGPRVREGAPAPGLARGCAASARPARPESMASNSASAWPERAPSG